MKEIILAHDFESVTGGATNNAHCYTKIATSTVTVQYHTRTSSGRVLPQLG